MASKLLTTAIVCLFIIAHGVALQKMHAMGRTDALDPENPIMQGD
jgi:hypothetical protein